MDWGGPGAHTIIFLVYPSAKFPDLQAKVANFLGLADRAGLFVGPVLIYAF